MPSHEVDYSFLLPFEETFDPIPSTLWMQRNWVHAFTLSAFYVIAVHVGEQVMQRRAAPLALRTPLAVWNSMLAIFSVIGCARMTPEFVHVLRTYGFEYSMCNASYAEGVTGFWVTAFALSKAFEFGDTAFIVLRRRPLLFLHWYHHISVLCYTWHAYKDHTAAGRWFIWMNYTVHAVMYTYYALRSFGWRFPKSVPMSVTVMQLMQMLMGTYIALRAYVIKANGGFCQQTYSNLYFSMLIYFTYFLLFANFFYNAYFKVDKYSPPAKLEPNKAD